jgi:hypothetical protein
MPARRKVRARIHRAPESVNTRPPAPLEMKVTPGAASPENGGTNGAEYGALPDSFTGRHLQSFHVAETRGVGSVDVGHAVVKQEHPKPGPNPSSPDDSAGLGRVDARPLRHKEQREAEARAGVVWRVVVVRIVRRVPTERRPRTPLECDVDAQVDAAFPRCVARKSTADPSLPPVPARQYFDRKDGHKITAVG